MHMHTTIQTLQTLRILRHYTRIIRQRFIFILLGIAFCAATTGIISICIPPVYQARTLLKVNNMTANSSSNDVYNAQALAVDYALLVTSPEVFQAAAQKLPGITAEQLQQTISDAPIENTQIIEIRAQAQEAQLAANIANVVTAVFIQLQAAQENDRLQNSANLLTRHIAATRLDLDVAQDYLSVLQNNHAAPASIAQQKSLVDTDQANYELLLTDYSQLLVQKLQAANTLSIAQAAQPPDKPASPQIVNNMLLAAAVSLLFMILLVLLLDWLDTTIKTSEDVINMTGLIPLGSVPASHKMESRELLDLAARSSIPVREALGMMGINLRAQLKGQRFLLVSGARTGVGATTVAVYLAISLAQMGMRVLLVDTNLRKPLLHEVFRGPNTHGLTNRLTDVRRFQEQPALYPGSWLQHWQTPVPNLWVLPAGPPAGQPTMANIQELQQLKEWLLGERQMPDGSSALPLVDLIICDTAPLGESGDTYGLSMIADGVVMVIEAGKEQKETFGIHAMHLQAPILGVVVNRQQAWQTTYYYANAQSTESKAAIYKEDVREEEREKDTLEQYNSPTYEERIVSKVPGTHLVAAHDLAPRKIAERPIPSTPHPSAPLTSATDKLALVGKLIPKTPMLFPSLSSGEYTASPATSSTSTIPQAGNMQLQSVSSPFLLQREPKNITTDVLTEASREPELHTRRPGQEVRTQFKTHIGKHD